MERSAHGHVLSPGSSLSLAKQIASQATESPKREPGPPPETWEHAALLLAGGGAAGNAPLSASISLPAEQGCSRVLAPVRRFS